MELITDLGTRTSVSSTGNKNTRRWGLFKCPSCSTAVERITQKGIKNNSCGAPVCRKATGAYNSHNSNYKDADKIKNMAYYSSFSDYYRRIIKERDTVWNSFSEFTYDMHTSYVALRATNVKRVTLHVNDLKPLSSTNCKWVPDVYTASTDFSQDVLRGIKHSLLLSQELSIPHSVVRRTLVKMDDTFGEYEYKVTSCPGVISRPTCAYHFTEYQYIRLRDRLIDNRKKTSSNVYLMKCNGYTKIGITSDITKRLNALTGSNPDKVVLIHTKEVPEASKVEKYLHNKYKDYNHHHEWFKLSDAQIKEITAYLDTKE